MSWRYPLLMSSQSTGLEAGDFLMHVCHDLRTAVRAIRAHTDLLLRDGQARPAPAMEERLGFIADGARKIDLLADGIASYSMALQIPRESFRTTPTEPLLRSVLAKLNKEIQEHQATVTYGSLPSVSGDPDRLMEVFENLLHNALRHGGPTSPVVHIGAERRAGEWLFTVRDNGPGMEACYLESIFQPFTRLHSTHPAGPGLGLAICRLIVQSHGGQIWAESGVGSGSTFRFTLPAD